MHKPHQIVAAAVICKDETVLVCKRHSKGLNAGLWEFPGGKLEQGESIDDCLKREIHEELGIDIHHLSYLDETIYRTQSGSIKLVFLRAAWKSGQIKLHVHSEHLWVNPEQISQLEFSPADIPMVENIMNSTVPLKSLD